MWVFLIKAHRGAEAWMAGFRTCSRDPLNERRRLRARERFCAGTQNARLALGDLTPGTPKPQRQKSCRCGRAQHRIPRHSIPTEKIKEGKNQARETEQHQARQPTMAGFGDLPAEHGAAGPRSSSAEEAEPDQPPSCRTLARTLAGRGWGLEPVPGRGADAQRADGGALLKRKNVLTGFARRTYLSEHTFRAKHRASSAAAEPEREFTTGTQDKVEAARIRASARPEGDATLPEGDGALRRSLGEDTSALNTRSLPRTRRGARQRRGVRDRSRWRRRTTTSVVASGTVVKAPVQALARRRRSRPWATRRRRSTARASTTTSAARTCMCRRTSTSTCARRWGASGTTCPKRLVHTWRHDASAVTSLQLFPNSGHLLLSGGAGFDHQRSGTSTTSASCCGRTRATPRRSRT